jgi:glycosyltransferase involved in cell wall biosynthesis
MSKSRILILGPLPPPEGGIATTVSNLLSSKLSNDFKLIHMDISTKRSLNKQGKIDTKNIISLFFMIILLIGKIIKSRPHIVQIESSSGTSFLKNSLFILVSKFAFCNVIISIHGSGIRFINFFESLPHLGKLYVKFIISKCDAVRILSEKWIKKFNTELNLKVNKIFVIPNGVDFEFFNINRYHSTLIENNCKILYLGAIGEKKGVFDLLDVSEILQKKGYEFNLNIVGPEMDEGCTEELKIITRKRKLEKYIEIHKEIKYKETVSFYSSANIFILPSYTEGLPMTLLEAMASGLPVVSTKVGAIPEIIEDGINGFLVNPGNVSDLAFKIEILINNSHLRKKMGLMNKTKVQEKYSLFQQINGFRSLYLQLLK